MGNLTSLHTSLSNGPSLTYVPDALNRRAQVANGTLTTAYGWDNAGNLTSVQLPNTQTVTNGYDTLNRLNSVTVGSMASFGYTLGAAGNKTAVTEQSGRAVSWGYSNLYQLNSEAVTGGAVNGTSGYGYDGAGNRLNRTSTLAGITGQTYTPNTTDELGGEGYDGNGNVTSSGSNTYTYNSLGRLTSATVGGVSTAYTYDGDGILESKTTNNVTTQFLTDGGVLNGYPQVLAEVVGGSVARSYTYGLTRIFMTDVASGKTRYFGTDGAGSTRVLMDESGNVTDTFDWAADGILVNHTGTTVCPFGFQGEYADADTGLVYLRARWMNPQMGRFMGMDGFEGDNEDPLSQNKYAFVKGEGGVNRMDPTGQYDIGSEMMAVGVASVISYTIMETGFQIVKHIGLPASFRVLSGRGEQFIKSWEQKRLKLYTDATGNATIGYGHLVEPDHEEEFKNGITDSRANGLFYEDWMNKAHIPMTSALTVSLSQSEYDSWASLYFNIGEAGIAETRTLRYFNAGQKDQAAQEWLGFSHGMVDGQSVTLSGLLARRQAEVNILLRGTYVDHQ